VGKKSKTLTWFNAAVVSAGTKGAVEVDDEEDAGRSLRRTNDRLRRFTGKDDGHDHRTS
jgi:hypothetical protein